MFQGKLLNQDIETMAKKVVSRKKADNEKVVEDKKTISIKEFSPYIAIAVFIFTTIVFFWGQLSGGSYFWEDFTEYVYPVQSFAATESAGFEIPHWNPYTFVGMPFVADLQAGFFYPFNRLLNFFVTDGHLSVWALQFIIILHFIIAQAGFFFLARSWKISSLGSMISAVSWGFSLMLVCHVIHPMIIYHLAWFPLVVMLFRQGLEQNSYKKTIFSGLILGMSMLSGHPQLTLYEAFFILLMGLWYFIFNIKEKKISGSAIGFYLLRAFLPLVIGAGIFAIQYMPSAELAELSQRKEMTYEAAGEGSLQFRQLYTAVNPKLFGFVDGSGKSSVPYHLTIDGDKGRQQAPYYYYWESAFYFGIAALILGLFAVSTSLKGKSKIFLLSAGIFGILFAMGSNGFIFPIFYNLPFFGSFRNPSRMMFWFVFALSLFAGFGFDSLWKNIGNKATFTRLLIIAGFISFLAVLMVTGAIPSAFDVPDQVASGVASASTIIFIIALAISIVAILINKKILNPFAGGILLVVIVFLDLNFAGASFNQSEKNPADVYKLPEQLKAQFTPQLPGNIFRVNTRMYNPSYSAMQRNQGMVDKIMLTEGYNPLILDRVKPPVQTREELNNIYNVKYQIDIDQAARQPVFTEKNNYFPRAWMVHNAEVIKSEDVEKYILEKRPDLRKTAVIEEDPGLELSKTPDVFAQGSAEIKEYDNNYISAHVLSDMNGLLCFSEIWYPAWKAYVDGKETNMLRLDYCFRAVPVPSGDHVVELKYESAAFSGGATVTLITLLLSIGGLVFAFIKQKAKAE